ncbi:MAG: PfkB family carbohydrate kinase [Candidatus Brocadiia bacterium]
MATLDVLFRSDEQNGGPVPRFEGFRLEGGGPVGTALVAASRLGARVGFVGTAGTDFAGDCKLMSLTRHGVDVTHVVRREGSERQVVLVWVDPETGDRSFSSPFDRRQAGLQPEELERGYITAAPYLHLDGNHPDAALTAARWVRDAGGTVVMDCATTSRCPSERRQELVSHTDVLICGSGFAQALTGETEVEPACRAALECGPEIVVQTEGEGGSYTATPDQQFHTPAFKVDVVDTTGAGDVFHGAYIVGLLRGWDVRRTAIFASAVSAMCCRHMGGRSGVGTFEETLDFCRKRGIEFTA